MKFISSQRELCDSTYTTPMADFARSRTQYAACFGFDKGAHGV
jgi:hypothetical protein